MFASFFITFIESLEAFLILGIILSYLNKLETKQFNKYIYMGVFLGIIVSLVIAYIVQVMLYSIDNELYQKYLMIGILLFATFVLSYMVVWMASQSKQIKDKIQENLKKLISTKNIIGMIFITFLAVLREGCETVLFFSSLSLNQELNLNDGFIGAGLFGTFLRALFGYNSFPTLLHFVAWIFYMFVSLTLWKKTYTYVSKYYFNNRCWC